MATTATLAPKKKIFYGVWIMTVMTLVYGAGCLLVSSHTMFWPSMIKENGFAPGDLGTIAAVTMWGMILWAPIVGVLADKLGPKKTIIIGLCSLLLSCVLVSTVTELWQMYVYFCIPVGIANATMLGIGLQTLVRKWYAKKAGMALAIMMVGASIFQAVMYPTLVKLASQMTFRPVILTTGIILLGISFLLVMFFIKDSPESMGLNIDGLSDEEKNAFMANLNGEAMAEKNNTVKEAVKMPQWWLWTLSYGLFTGVLVGLMQNITAIGMNYGYDAARVGMLMMFFMVASLFGRLIGGWLGDKVGKRPVLITAASLTALIMLSGYLWVRDPLGINIFTALVGLILTMPLVLIPPFLGDLFGKQNMGKILGIAFVPSTVITGLYPLFAGMIKKSTGTYSLFMLVCSITMLVVAVMMICLRPTATEINNLGMAKKKS